MKSSTITPPAARFPGGYDVDRVSTVTGLACLDPSLADQSSKAEADINTIIERFHLTGEVPVSNRVPFPDGTDCDELFDFREAQDLLLEAARSFNSLPAPVRAQFANDPVGFADFASDPKNLDQLRAWGLAPPAPEKPA